MVKFMITIEEACAIVAHKKNIKYISKVKELSDFFVITILDDNGEILLDSSYTVNKITGDVGVYNILMKQKTFSELKLLEVPQKYQFNK